LAFGDEGDGEEQGGAFQVVAIRREALDCCVSLVRGVDLGAIEHDCNFYPAVVIADELVSDILYLQGDVMKQGWDAGGV
jgi:hypothetical protein